jgi:dethiobiotin synthetase
MSLRFSCFITGTDTGIGKTLVTSAFLHALTRSGVQAAGMKPVAAGVELIRGEMQNEDVAILAAESRIMLPRALTTPYLLREAAAPHIAAGLEQVQIEPAHLLRCYQQVAQQSEAVVVEGVGGFRVPLSETFDTADFAALLQLDIILVVGLRLGCINHALLTAEAIAARGLHLAGWVANLIDVTMPHQEANLQALRERLPAPLLGVLPWMAAPSAAAAADCLDFSLLATWPEGD